MNENPSIDDLRGELADTEANLEAAGAAWLEKKAAGRDLSATEASISLHEQTIRRLSRRIKRKQRRTI